MPALYRSSSIARLLVVLSLWSLLPLASLDAQSAVVTGKVTAVDGGLPLQGVTVLLRGTNLGTLTDAAGAYRLALPATGRADILTFRLIGYKPTDATIQGRTTVDVALETATTTLSSLVVTANAIVRETKELGYSVAQIEPAQLVVARSSNVLNKIGRASWRERV